ncbi:MAG: ATP-binding cassette domain-containing protein [Chloroflexi bacterium]|jgi:ABC-2 type transport system ATP-binding protein|nr:ATP-binding cassette domain-containing protein [Chloroflexota bacterium]
MSSPIIEVSELVKKYGDRLAVNGVSFQVQEGEIFGLLGPNGAGKTTTLSILSTLLQPDAGKVQINGYDLAQDAERIKPLIGLVPQELALYPTLSAWDNLAFFGRIYGLRGRRLREQIDFVLELVGLRDRAGDAVETFSGGMKRRLNLAAGLIHQPRLLFLDEPTVGVDPQSRNFIFEHIERLKAAGMTILYTTHYMEEAERLCDRVAIMDEGRILALDTPQKLIGLLGGGVIHLAIPSDFISMLLPAIRALPHVQAVSPLDGRIKIETTEARSALLELIQLCHTRDVPILSLEILEPSLESVFLHLTGKHLRD